METNTDVFIPHGQGLFSPGGRGSHALVTLPPSQPDDVLILVICLTRKEKVPHACGPHFQDAGADATGGGRLRWEGVYVPANTIPVEAAIVIIIVRGGSLLLCILLAIGYIIQVWSISHYLPLPPHLLLLLSQQQQSMMPPHHPGGSPYNYSFMHPFSSFLAASGSVPLYH